MDKKKEILEAFNYRYACKLYDADKKISEDDFRFILETGRLSPSSFGWEPWQFVVVQNPETRQKLREASWGAQEKLDTTSHFVLLLARQTDGLKHGSDYLKHIAQDVQKLPEDVQNMKLDFFNNFAQNDFDLTDDRKVFDWSTKQVYIPLANMMTAAASIGIDSTPIEGFNRAKVEEILVEEGIMDLKEFGLGAMVSFGYRSKDDIIYPKTRRTFEDVVKWV